MKACVLILMTVVAFASTATIKSTNNTQLSGGISPMLILVATVDGKTFFSDRSTPRNWTQASTWCKELGMRLASITSASQFAAFKIASNDVLPAGDYWTGGRDSHEITQFRWDHNNAELSASDVTFIGREENYYTAVELYNSGQTIILRNEESADKNTGVLCETL